MTIHTELSNPPFTVILYADHEKKEVRIHTSQSITSFDLIHRENIISALENLVSEPQYMRQNKVITIIEGVRVQRNIVSEFSEYEYAIRVRGNRNNWSSIKFQGDDELTKLLTLLKEIKVEYDYRRELEKKILENKDMFVECNGKKISVYSGGLNLNEQGLTSILDIKGLEKIKYIARLFLNKNKITNIE